MMPCRPCRRWRTLLLGILLPVAAIAGTPRAIAQIAATETIVAGWEKPGGHPLIGKIWSPTSAQLADGFELARGPRAATPIARAVGLKGHAFVLLGEVHDNPEHHLLRAGLLDDMTERSPWGRGTHPPIVTEHIRADQAPGLERYRDLLATRSMRPGVDDLFEQLEWDKTGWQPTAIFRPLYSALLESHLPLRIGDPPRETVRAVARGGLPALPAGEAARLRLDIDYPAPLAASLAAELEASHCGMLPAAAVPAMALAQRYRDAYLAAALISAEFTLGPAILLAGNGHVRTDRGVPWHLRQRAPGKAILAVMLIEVEDGKNDPLDYVPRDTLGKPATDYIVFTPRAVREDPCKQMRTPASK
jgi:uncharacterized iron-regulated protein